MAGSARLRRWLGSGAAAVGTARERLDAINVFPVADSDTGTNLYMTLMEGNRAVARLPESASHREVVAAFARGSLMGARGNSGVIVSQYLSAFLSAMDQAGGLDGADGATIASSLEAASDAAYEAVGEPVEGTILSVARAAAVGGRAAADAGARVEAVAVAAVVSARAELARTHEVLEVAREAGVVDAGAAGLVLQLEMLAETVAGRDALAALDEVEWEITERTGGISPAHAAAALHRATPGSGAYEVMFVALRPDVAPAPGEEAVGPVGLKRALREIGDSVAVTGIAHLWQAHVHTDDPELAIDVALRADATQAVVRDIAATHAAGRAGVGVVALTTCPGLARELSSTGAAVLVVPNPSGIEPLDLQRAVQDASDDRAVVVAGSPALQAAVFGLPEGDEMPEVDVVRSRTEPEVVAALAAAAMVLADGGDPAEAMRAAVARTRTAVTTVDALGDDLERLVDDSTEVATVIVGRGVSPGVAEAAIRRLAASRPLLEVQVFEGRQATPAVILGVEARA